MLYLGGMEMRSRNIIDDQSGWFDGHFPDDPIFPGIAQLEMVCDLISAEQGIPLRLLRLSRVKFKKIIRPGETLDIHAACGNKENSYTFTIMSEGQEACSGMIFLQPSTTTSQSP